MAENLSKIAGKIEFTEQRTDYITEKNKKLETKTKNVLSTQKIMGLKFDEVIIFLQGFYNRPIIAQKTLAFNNRKIVKKQGQIPYKELTIINKKNNSNKETYNLQLTKEDNAENNNFYVINPKKKKHNYLHF